MVGLIEKPELPAIDIDLSDDRDVNRYYYYICNGVDTIHTAHIEQDFVDAILDLVSSNLRDQFPDFTKKVMVEIKEDFTKNIKKAIVKFALTDPAEEYPSEVGHFAKIENCIKNKEFDSYRCKNYKDNYIKFNILSIILYFA